MLFNKCITNYIFQIKVLSTDSFQPFVIFLFFMFAGQSQQNLSSYNKAEKKEEKVQVDRNTANKKEQVNLQIYTQVTPRVNKKVLLFDDNNQKHLFPLVRDREIGIYSQYQNIVITSYNDDDKRTSSTQMHRGMMQTIDDLYSVLEDMHGSDKQ